MPFRNEPFTRRRVSQRGGCARFLRRVSPKGDVTHAVSHHHYYWGSLPDGFVSVLLDQPGSAQPEVGVPRGGRSTAKGSVTVKVRVVNR